LHEIREIVAGYGRVAGHCAEGGFDGVELQCCHSPIVRGFLSPATNKRTDAYGGSLENRARLLEIVDVVREAIGAGRALGVRICGDELIEGGTTIDEAQCWRWRSDPADVTTAPDGTGGLPPHPCSPARHCMSGFAVGRHWMRCGSRWTCSRTRPHTAPAHGMAASGNAALAENVIRPGKGLGIGLPGAREWWFWLIMLVRNPPGNRFLRETRKCRLTSATPSTAR
jgi:hypothetical protein